MIQNNFNRWNLWNQNDRPLNYEKFYQICLDNNTVPFGKMEFATKVGLILTGSHTFPELDHVAAYSAMVQDTEANTQRINDDTAKMNLTGATVVTTCCGGGTVR